jgi:hypothetical protein
MKIKITGKSQELFEHYLTAVLNFAAVAAMGGHIPTQRDIEKPDIFGRYWYREKEGATLDRFNIYPLSNDYFANVTEQGENYIVLDFWYRHDRSSGGSFVAALCNLLVIRFFDNVSIIAE